MENQGTDAVDTLKGEIEKLEELKRDVNQRLAALKERISGLLTMLNGASPKLAAFTGGACPECGKMVRTRGAWKHAAMHAAKRQPA